ncbi:hypothetical protein CBF23_008990 [Marinomonas agarivorans]|nr:hypothetical protein CBF23_008990 [Marinomonas agarivorans]
MKNYRLGTHRAVPPQETLDRVLPHLPAMGITRLANITGLDEIGIPVMTACRPNSKSISVSQGKGVSLAAAKVSATMEAIEIFHAENIHLPVQFTSLTELKKLHDVVDITQLPSMDVSPFSAHERRLWIEGRALATNNAIYVPYDLVHCDFTIPLPPASGYFQLSTNGLASGNTQEEAICHGLCELIERDAMTLWSLLPVLQKNAKKVDLSSISDTSIQTLIAQITKAKVMISVWNITSDLGIPTFFCTIMNEQDSPHRPLYPSSGCGTHPSKTVALSRAITEAAQTRLTLISGSRDDASIELYKQLQDSNYQQVIKDTVFAPPPNLDFNSIKSWEHVTIDEDLSLLLNQLVKVGLDNPIVVDLTKAEFNIPVVRVIAPGLEGIHDVPGYAFGQRAQCLQQKQNCKKERQTTSLAEHKQEGTTL